MTPPPNMIIPAIPDGSQEPLDLLSFLRWVTTDIGREARLHILLSKLVDVLSYQLIHSTIQHFSLFVQNQVVREAVVLFKAEVRCIVVMDLANCFTQRVPRIRHGRIWSILWVVYDLL